MNVQDNFMLYLLLPAWIFFSSLHTELLQDRIEALEAKQVVITISEIKE